MDALPLFLISFVTGVLGWALIAKQWLFPWLVTLPKNEALALTIVPHVFRYIGLSFLITGVTSTTLNPAFSLWAAYGDFAAALLAFAATIALLRNSRFAIPLVVIFSVVGLLDFMIAFTQGLTHIHPGEFGATYFLPAMLVPFLLVSHVVALFLLFRARENTVLSDKAISN